MAKPRLYIPMGIPGCGKSTWPKMFIPNVHVVSTDEYRRHIAYRLSSFHESYAQHNRLVFEMFYACIYGWLNGDDLYDNREPRVVYADATNLSADARSHLRDIAELVDAETHLLVFTNVHDALERNAERDEDEVVPEDVMQKMLAEYEEAMGVIHSERYTTRTLISSFYKEQTG